MALQTRIMTRTKTQRRTTRTQIVFEKVLLETLSKHHGYKSHYLRPLKLKKTGLRPLALPGACNQYAVDFAEYTDFSGR